jgi:predicted GNAT family acetyltransferase
MARDARTQGFRIVPLCPFVNAWRRKHPDWADAFEV